MDTQGTGYHESVRELRAELMGEHRNFQRLTNEAMDVMSRLCVDHTHEASREKFEHLPPHLREAMIGCTMASSYAYTLAGVLRYVELRHGGPAAREVAGWVDETLTNGDESDLNADLDSLRTPQP
jgi:hypothetical protein